MSQQEINGQLAANAAAASAPIVLTKEEKIAKIDSQIARLQAKRDDVVNDRVTVKAKKEVYVPNVGDKVLATIGRNTATSQSKIVPGTVTAVKLPEEGSKGATQVRVRILEGTFDEQLVTLYPAQLVPEGNKQQANAEAAEAASMGSAATNPDAA